MRTLRVRGNVAIFSMQSWQLPERLNKRRMLYVSDKNIYRIFFIWEFFYQKSFFPFARFFIQSYS